MYVVTIFHCLHWRGMRLIMPIVEHNHKQTDEKNLPIIFRKNVLKRIVGFKKIETKTERFFLLQGEL